MKSSDNTHRRQQNILSQEIIQEVRKENCFDFLRYLFAFSLILAHFCTLTETDQCWFISGGMSVKSFFTIAGFLVTYSLLRRRNLKSYVIKRFVRIVPAYICAIVFCFIVGLWLTDLSTYDFLHNSQTWKYVISNFMMLNWLEPNLPGVFTQHHIRVMNASLWSMKQEMIFYALTPFLVWMIARYGKQKVMIPIILLFCLIHNWCNVQMQYFMFFFGGMAVLFFLEKYYRYFRWLFSFSLIAFVATNYIIIPYVSDFLYALEPITFALTIIGIAYHMKPMFFLSHYDNITYGLYLYHFPVIQIVIHFGFTENLLVAFILSLFFTTILACLSWFIIEKRLIQKFSTGSSCAVQINK